MKTMTLSAIRMLVCWTLLAGVALAGETPKLCNPTPSDQVAGVVSGGTLISTVAPVDPGTVIDGGLVWLKNAGCFGQVSRAYAEGAITTLKRPYCELGDASGTGKWRLPTSGQLKSRLLQTGKFKNVPTSGCFWSSSTVVCIDGIERNPKPGDTYYLWPVYDK